MASSADLERLRQLYARWSKGDFTYSEILDPEIKSESFGVWPEGQGKTENRRELAAAIGRWLSAWQRPLTIDAEEFVQRGDRILVLVRWNGRGKGSGLEIEATGAHLWTFRDGLAVRFDVYRDREEAGAALEGA
ncbi:MAG TPA: nuclear transport factor 2 family protein [Solirubrobacterales bacterium]|nr:nuclear transport factor 2 family protein [Solirubrobacterales bacterium]